MKRALEFGKTEHVEAFLEHLRLGDKNINPRIPLTNQQVHNILNPKNTIYDDVRDLQFLDQSLAWSRAQLEIIQAKQQRLEPDGSDDYFRQQLIWKIHELRWQADAQALKKAKHRLRYLDETDIGKLQQLITARENERAQLKEDHFVKRTELELKRKMAPPGKMTDSQDKIIQRLENELAVMVENMQMLGRDMENIQARIDQLQEPAFQTESNVAV